MNTDKDSPIFSALNFLTDAGRTSAPRSSSNRNPRSILKNGSSVLGPVSQRTESWSRRYTNDIQGHVGGQSSRRSPGPSHPVRSEPKRYPKEERYPAHIYGNRGGGRGQVQESRPSLIITRSSVTKYPEHNQSHHNEAKSSKNNDRLYVSSGSLQSEADAYRQRTEPGPESYLEEQRFKSGVIENRGRGRSQSRRSRSPLDVSRSSLLKDREQTQFHHYEAKSSGNFSSSAQDNSSIQFVSSEYVSSKSDAHRRGRGRRNDSGNTRFPRRGNSEVNRRDLKYANNAQTEDDSDDQSISSKSSVFYASGSTLDHSRKQHQFDRPNGTKSYHSGNTRFPRRGNSENRRDLKYANNAQPEDDSDDQSVSSKSSVFYASGSTADHSRKQHQGTKSYRTKNTDRDDSHNFARPTVPNQPGNSKLFDQTNRQNNEPMKGEGRKRWRSESEDHKKRGKPVYVICDNNKRNQNLAEEGKRDARQIPVGFKYLKELSEKESPDITCEILNPNRPFSAFVEKQDLQPDWLFLMVKIVAKVCSSEFEETRNKMLNDLCRSQFLRSVSCYLGEVNIETRKSTIENLPSFVRDIVSFYSAVIEFLPKLAVDQNLTKEIAKTIKAVESIHSDHGLDIDEAILLQLNALNDRIEDHKKMMERPKKVVQKIDRLQYISEQPPPENFRELELYPTYEDLTRHSFGFVRPNKKEGKYNDVEHYLDVQFRLLREDFIDPLRRGLRQYLEAKESIATRAKKGGLKSKYESLRFYPKCKFEEVRSNEKGQVEFLLNFDINGRLKIKWEYSKRFMHGSLLLFTCDNFQTFFCGTVSQRDLKLLSSGKILISLPNDVQTDKNFLSIEYMMAESETFFEPYFLVMKSLKTMNESNFPMRKYIVEGNSQNTYPRYLEEIYPWIVFDYQVDPFDVTHWPTSELLNLDKHQHNAFVKALTSEFCVIQGPPGTGKTFIGLKIVEVLLQNIKLNEKRIKSPLLVVCYTNHALDQFLEGILKYTQKIIRVGSQSKSEVLKDFNLRGKNQFAFRNSAAARNQLGPTVTKIRTEVKENLAAVNKLTGKLRKFEKPCGIIKFSILCKLMTENQKRKLNSSDALVQWLLECKSEKPVIPKLAKKRSDQQLERETSSSEASETEEGTKEIMDEDEEKNDHLVDEDDTFELDADTQRSLDSDSFYEVTKEEISTAWTQFVDRLHSIEGLSDDETEDLAALYNERQDLMIKINLFELKHQILEEQLASPNYTVEKIERILAKDVHQLSLRERWLVYWSWVKVLRNNILTELQETEQKYRSSVAQYDEVKQMEDLYVVKDAHVIGMTTTCAARLHTLLNALNPAIVIVEEAAEVLETHIVTSLSKSCEHVILIGDHKQLKPSAAVYELSKHYNIDVSLFERMINNGMECPMLNVQHRMRPEISSLITPLIYPDLKNARAVESFENIRGMEKNLFFLKHNNYEQDVEDTSSRKNNFEADFVIELCCYLILQGYDPEKITILTTYTGQMFLLREKKRRRQLIQNVKCIVVDKYQGEENDIILLSLVRSNQEAKIGFLKTENRVCVALSRAKMGFYIVGNVDNLTKSSPGLWGRIEENLRGKNAIGDEMTLYCPRHMISTKVSCVKDFDKVREGGCSYRCGELLQCGHTCKSLCHSLDREHKEIKCREPCGKLCSRGLHNCHKYCFENCGPCTDKIEYNLTCGHQKALPCNLDPKNYQCDTIVDDVSPLCNHQVKRKCCQKPEDVPCPHPCEDRLECGHACRQKCHKKLDPDHLEYKCHKACEKFNKNCSLAHKCGKRCFEECGLCLIKLLFTLKCGHEEQLSCSTNIENIKCFKPCEKICPDCKQKCKKLCHEDCSPCKYIVEKQIAGCGHTVKIQCHIRPEQNHCTKQCKRVLPCGHKCMAKCRDRCGSVICQELVKRSDLRGLCGHSFVNVPCFQSREIPTEETYRKLLKFCDAPCNKLLKCKDPCTSTCGKCWQGRLHEPCQMNCGSIGICGHSCKYPCRQLCPPCEEPCSYRCKHSKCPKKCGVPCKQCQEPCEWRCRHKRCSRKCGEICDREPCNEACPKILPCGHACIGFCGEPCPPKCRECNPEIKEIVFGFEDEEDARFVYLEDCQHTIVSEAMDMFLNTTQAGGEIVMKVCPLCKTAISRTLRYMNYVKNTYSDIQAVKLKIFGSQKTLIARRKELHNNLVVFRGDSLMNIKMTGLQRMHKMVDEYLVKVKVVRNVRDTVSNAELNTIDYFYRVFTDINSRLDSLAEENIRGETKHLHSGSVTQDVVEYVKNLLARMYESTLQISEQLVEDIGLELRRFHKMIDYSLVLRNQFYLYKKNDVTISGLLKNLENQIFGTQRFDEIENIVNETFEKLQESLKAPEPLTAEEKKMINQAMATSFNRGLNSTGHWFKCTNGHVYVITECGGAMEKGKCPECGEVIGGENHAYVDTAILASDMDGATAPAWSQANNMGNYVF